MLCRLKIFLCWQATAVFLPSFSAFCPSLSYNAIQTQNFLCWRATTMFNVLTLNNLLFTQLHCSAGSNVDKQRLCFCSHSKHFSLHPSTMLCSSKIFWVDKQRPTFCPHSQRFALHTATMLCSFEVFCFDQQWPCFCSHSQHFALHPATILCRLQVFGVDK